MAVRVLCNCEADQDFEAANNGFDFKWGPGLRYGDPDSRACQSLQIDEFPSNFLSPDHALFVDSDDDEYPIGFLDEYGEDDLGGIFVGAEARIWNDRYAQLAARYGLDCEEDDWNHEQSHQPTRNRMTKQPATDEFFYEFGSRLPTCIGSRKFAAFINHFVISVKEAHEERRTYSKHGRKSRVARVRGENAFA